jgi:two-component system heavy metal sensor histidine kinase CusS
MRPSGPQARPWSLTIRLVSLQTLATAVLFGAAFLILYRTIASHLDEDNRQALQNQILVLEQWLGMRGTIPAHGTAGENDAAKLLGVIPDLFVRVEDAGHQVLLQSPHFDPTWLGAFPPSDTDAVTWRAPDKRNFLLQTLSLPNPGNHGTARQLLVAYDISDDDTLLRRLRQRMGVVFMLALGCGAVLALLISRGVFRPLAQLTAATAGIHASQLNARVGETRWPIEVAALAREYDAMLARLEDSFRRLARFASDLSHELRTPINNLRGEAEVALSRDRTPAEYRLVLESSLEECSRLSRLIDTLLFIARADNPAHGIRRRPIDAAAECHALTEFFEPMINERGLTLLVRGQAQAYCDPDLLRRALTNLLDNAVKHTPPGGHIDLTVRTTEDCTEIEVRDNGTGIPVEQQPRLFERFYRGERHPGEATANTGFGLGLAIVKSIMDLHAGTVRVNSTPGDGTTVTLRFPNPK